MLGGCPIDTSSNPKLQDRGIHNQLAFFVLQTYTVNQEIFIQDFFTIFNFSFLYRKLIFKFLILVFLDSNENYMTMKIFLNYGNIIILQYAVVVLFITILEIVAAILVFVYWDEVRDRLAAQEEEEDEASGEGSGGVGEGSGGVSEGGREVV